MDQKTILIAEDDVLLRNALTDKLTREGFTVQVACNGEECVKKAFAFRPDVILLDVLMPKMGGMMVLKNLRDDAWGKTVKVIFLTNMSGAQKLMEESPYHSDGYLIKSETKIGDVVTKIKEQLDIAKILNLPSNAESGELPEYRCTCGKLLFKGVLLFSTIEIKCKRCHEVCRIDNTDQRLLG